MHEMLKRRSRFGATVYQTTSTRTKGKSRQIKATKAWRKLADVKKEPRQPTEADEGNQVSSIQVNQGIRSNPIKSDQIKPNPIKSNQIRSNQTKSDQKNGPTRIKARAVRSRLARTSVDFGRARWLRGNAGRMNGQAKDLSNRNTFFIYATDERGSGLEENLRLSSLMFAYVRLIGEKMFEARRVRGLNLVRQVCAP
jgi:hypothetical protein